jgi:phage gpG-like protein
MSSEGFSIKVKRDDITPDIRKKLKGMKDLGPILRAMGTQIVSLTKRAFRDPSLRAAPWKNKKKWDPIEERLVEGGPSNLIAKGMLMSSIRITSLSKSNVTIGTDRKYGAIHQLGGVIRPKKAKALVFTIGGVTIRAGKVTMPARPYFPFLPNGSLAPVAVGPVGETLAAASAKALGVGK